ncbi:MAG: ribbon-helix-helix protein, CopG family, partial [Betaproteobacteria bacterium]
MTLTVRLPDHVAQELAEYCVKRGMTKSEAVKQALEALLHARDARENRAAHPFIGGDRGDGSDVSGSIKAALRARFRKDRR